MPNLVPRASFPLTSGRKTRALGASISGMRHRYHTYRLRTARACAEKPDMQNSVISIVIWKWMLPELSFSDRWSRGTKLWERDWLPELSFSDRWSRGTKLWERDCNDYNKFVIIDSTHEAQPIKFPHFALVYTVFQIVKYRNIIVWKPLIQDWDCLSASIESENSILS